MVGGPCGQPVIYPNSKVKRGWSVTKVKWRFAHGTVPDKEVWCRDTLYVRKSERTKAGKLKQYYVPMPLDGEPEPEPPTPEALIQALAGSPFWSRMF